MDPEVTDVSATGASSTPAPETPANNEPTGDSGLMDAVLSALSPEEGSQPSTQDQKPIEPQAAPEGEQPKAEGADDPTDEELKNYSPTARKRIGQLLGQRRELREQLDAHTREVEPLKAQAKVADDLRSFVQTSGLTAEDLDTGFSIMGAMRSNPQAALNALMPIVTALQERVGNVISDDLRADVQAGRITVDHALQLSRARAESAHSQELMQEREARARAEQERSQFAQTVHGASTAVSDWERSKSTSDPDWHLKQERIAQLVELEVRRNGFPQNAKAAVDLHQKALDTVNSELRKFRPAPKPMRMASGSANPNSVTEPKSYLEAAMAGLQTGRG